MIPGFLKITVTLPLNLFLYKRYTAYALSHLLLSFEIFQFYGVFLTKKNKFMNDSFCLKFPGLAICWLAANTRLHPIHAAVGSFCANALGTGSSSPTYWSVFFSYVLTTGENAALC